MTNPDHLRYFAAFAASGSLHSAARQVGRSPAALSKALAQLESAVGRTLVSPKGRGLVLTPEGRAFLEQAEEVLRAFDALLVPSPHLHRRLRVGTFEVFSTHWAPELFGTEHELELRELSPGALERALVDGQIDAGLTYSPVPTRGVDVRELGAIPMKIFARKGAFRGISLDALPFVAPLPSLGKAPTRVQGLDGWPPSRPRRVVAWVTLLESALALVRAGRCAIYLPEPLAERHNAVVRAGYRLYPVTSAKLPARREKTRAFLLQRSGEPSHPAILTLEMRLKAALQKLPVKMSGIAE